MEPLEMQYNEVVDGEQVISSGVSVIATLQAIIDRVNELTRRYNLEKTDGLSQYMSKEAGEIIENLKISNK